MTAAALGIPATPADSLDVVKSAKQTMSVEQTFTPAGCVRGGQTNRKASMTRQAALGEFEQLLLLAILGLKMDATGAGVSRRLEEKAGRDISRGALYSSLDRLERKGFVTWKVEEECLTLVDDSRRGKKSAVITVAVEARRARR